MGCLFQSKKKAIFPYMDILAKFENIPNDQFLCPICHRVPELLNVSIENGTIELKCPFHDEIKKTIQDYVDSIKSSQFNNFNINEKSNKCPNHPDKEIKNFCFDCDENYCESDKDDHQNHKIKSINDLGKEVDEYLTIIDNKNKILTNIIEFNKLIMNTYLNSKNNYFNILNVINLGKTIKKENERDGKLFDYFVKSFNKNIEIQKTAQNTLKKNYKKELDGNEKTIPSQEENVKEKIIKLGDDGLKLMSQIIFKQLTEIDISDNNIKNIECLKNMSLPFLEYLDMSYNKIENIEPIALLNCEDIKYLCLQNNNIKNIEPFLQSNFNKLEIFRLEGNRIKLSGTPLLLLKKKYNEEILTYKAKFVEEIENKYNHKIFNKNEANLSGIKEEKNIIKFLYYITPKNNNINYLKLDNNEIEDTSLLTRIPLPNLQVLDLSLNNIKNVKFLTKMNISKIKTIYLDNNYIKNIWPLIKMIDNSKWKNLKMISLNENKIDINNKDNKECLLKLKERNIEIDINIEN